MGCVAARSRLVVDRLCTSSLVFECVPATGRERNPTSIRNYGATVTFAPFASTSVWRCCSSVCKWRSLRIRPGLWPTPSCGLYRASIGRRGLLEWVTAAAAGSDRELALIGFYRRMAGAVVLAGAAALVIVFAGSASRWVAIPLLGAWMLSPAIAWWVSRAPRADEVALSDTEIKELRLTARRTWRFFETFVTEEDNMLPPDNFQEDPHPVIAHRTSPTNLGLYLLSILAARDFGCLASPRPSTGWKLRFKRWPSWSASGGHFYNWYDTRDLRRLDPEIHFIGRQRKSCWASRCCTQRLPGNAGRACNRSDHLYRDCRCRDNRASLLGSRERRPRIGPKSPANSFRLYLRRSRRHCNCALRRRWNLPSG